MARWFFCNYIQRSVFVNPDGVKFSRALLKRGDFDKPAGPGKPLWTGVLPYGYLDFLPFGRDPAREGRTARGYFRRFAG